MDRGKGTSLVPGTSTRGLLDKAASRVQEKLWNTDPVGTRALWHGRTVTDSDLGAHVNWWLHSDLDAVFGTMSEMLEDMGLEEIPSMDFVLCAVFFDQLGMVFNDGATSASNTEKEGPGPVYLESLLRLTLEPNARCLPTCAATRIYIHTQAASDHLVSQSPHTPRGGTPRSPRRTDPVGSPREGP